MSTPYAIISDFDGPKAAYVVQSKGPTDPVVFWTSQAIFPFTVLSLINLAAMFMIIRLAKLSNYGEASQPADRQTPKPGA